jgi:methionyl-tRNA synthetase
MLLFQAEIPRGNSSPSPVIEKTLQSKRRTFQMITNNGQKMSKSLGNVITLEEFFTGNNPSAIYYLSYNLSQL